MTTLVHGEVVRGTRVLLRDKRLGDAPDDYRWRCDPELARYDATRPITMAYQEYLAIYREEVLFPNPHRRSLTIEDEAGRHIGNIMYYNIDAMRGEVELGITIGVSQCRGQGYGAEAARLLVEYLLKRKDFGRVYLKTLAWNRRAQHCFENVGFVECGRSHRGRNSFVLMEYRREWMEPSAEQEDGR